MFKDLKINEEIVEVLTKLGFTTPTEIQEKSIPVVLEGRDVVGRSQTGSGKTLAFGVGCVEKALSNIDGKISSLIVCPTRELVSQVCDQLRKIANNFKIKVTPIFGGSSMTKQVKALKEAHIVVGTPGRLMDHLRKKNLNLQNLKIVVLDEADEMLNMGFKEDIETILEKTPNSRQTVMYSATMPQAIKNITSNYQKDAVYIEVGVENSAIKNIKQLFVLCKKEKKVDTLLTLYKNLQPSLSIIFCNTKRMVDILNKDLSLYGFNCVALHGDLKQSQRRNVLQSIKDKSSSANVLIATDVCARGIDIDNIDFVFNYDIPYDLQYYTHRIGRTARIGKTGCVVNLVSSENQLALLQEFAKETNAEIFEAVCDVDNLIHTNEDIKEKQVKAKSDGAKLKRKNKKKSSSRNKDQKNKSKTNDFKKDKEQMFSRNKSARSDRKQNVKEDKKISYTEFEKQDSERVFKKHSKSNDFKTNNNDNFSKFKNNNSNSKNDRSSRFSKDSKKSKNKAKFDLETMGQIENLMPNKRKRERFFELKTGNKDFASDKNSSKGFTKFKSQDRDFKDKNLNKKFSSKDKQSRKASFDNFESKSKFKNQDRNFKDKKSSSRFSKDSKSNKSFSTEKKFMSKDNKKKNNDSFSSKKSFNSKKNPKSF